MTKTFLTISNNKKSDIEFSLICHAACDETGKFQWFLKDDPNDNIEMKIEDVVCESITLDSEWIKENAEDKWLACHCAVEDEEYEYTEMLCHLSSDAITIIRDNPLDVIELYDEKEDLKINYELTKKQAKIKIMVELDQDKTLSISETRKKIKMLEEEFIKYLKSEQNN